MKEQRNTRYSFESKKALVRFFSQWYSKDTIEKYITDTKKLFTIRKHCSAEETKLQFIKKCEFAMMRALRASSDTAYIPIFPKVKGAKKAS